MKRPNRNEHVKAFSDIVSRVFSWKNLMPSYKFDFSKPEVLIIYSHKLQWITEMIFVLPFFILVALGCLPASTKAIARIIRHTKNALGAMTS